MADSTGKVYLPMYQDSSCYTTPLVLESVHNSTGHVLNAVQTNSRINGTEHGQIQTAICQAEGGVLNAVSNNGRSNASEHAQIGYRVCDAEGKILTSIGEHSCDIIGSVHDVAYKDAKNICDATASIVGNVVNTSNVVRDSVERSAENASNNVFRTSADLKDEVNRTSGLNLEATERNGVQSLLSIERNAGESRAQAERIAGEVRSAINNVNQNVLLTSKDQLLEICKVEGALSRQAADNTASITLEALKNKEALARQLAECCCELKELTAAQSCEIKELIRSESCDIKERLDDRSTETNLLIRELDATKVRDSLNAANTENLILRLCEKKSHGSP